jgi:hypothetical protein
MVVDNHSGGLTAVQRRRLDLLYERLEVVVSKK